MNKDIIEKSEITLLSIKKLFYRLLVLFYIVILGFFAYAGVTRTWNKLNTIFLIIWIITSFIGTVYLAVFDIGMPNSSKFITREGYKISINFKESGNYLVELILHGLLIIVIALTFPFLFMIDTLDGN